MGRETAPRRGQGPAHAIRQEVTGCGGLEGWFAPRALDGMKRGRIARGRATRRSAVADAFFAALAGGHDQAVKCLAGELGEAGKEVRDYLVSAD